MPRNAGNFTRGSQLQIHEYLMWFASAKLPFIGWFFLFMAIFTTAVSMKLADHEVQMVLMKIYAAGWRFMEFNSHKILNLTLASGEVVRAPVGMIASHPDVVVAWAHLMRCFWGSLVMSLGIAVPVAIWFVLSSTGRGKAILEERHQRGAMLVDAPELARVIQQHNRAQIAEELVARFPGKTMKWFLGLPFAARKAMGIHHPYLLAGIPYPYRTEQSHTMVIGTTGTGKTTQMRDMIAQMRARLDRAVVFDLTGAYVEAFYNPETDTILNPMDARCPSWTLFDEAKNHADFTAIAAALLPIDGGAAEPFWILAARTLFVETCVKLVKDGKATNQMLASRLMMADLKAVHKMLANTVADPLTAPEAARMAESIRAVFNTNAQALRFLPADREPFSITDWIKGERAPGSILFITSTHNELTLNRALLTLWMNLAVHALMTLPRTNNLRTWFFFDEVHALHRLPAIENGLQTARGFGGAFVLGIHSFAKLSETYGREGAINLTSLARTKLILATADRETAEQCSDFIGQREVRMMDEAYSYGYSNIRDAATITPRSEIQPLVIPDDIMKLPNLRGFVTFPEGFDAARIKLAWKHYETIAPGYVLRKNVEPLGYLDEDTSGDTSEAGGREGQASPEAHPDEHRIGDTESAVGQPGKTPDEPQSGNEPRAADLQEMPAPGAARSNGPASYEGKAGAGVAVREPNEASARGHQTSDRRADPSSRRVDQGARELATTLDPQTKASGERSPLEGPTPRQEQLALDDDHGL